MKKRQKSLVSKLLGEMPWIVEKANESVQPPIDMAMIDPGRSSLLLMNDYCLMDIFSEKTVGLMDLCALAETCRRFRSITQRVAPKAVTIHEPFHTDELMVENTKQTLCDAKRIFQYFGSNFSEIRLTKVFSLEKAQRSSKPITSWCVDCNNRKSSILNLVARHSVNLKCLIFDGLPISKRIKLRPIFRRLQKLHLNDVSLECVPTLFAGLDSLVELIMIDVSYCHVILENHFPKLERFGYSCWTDKSQKTIETFIPRHRTLKALELSIGLTEATLRGIVNDCTDLNELKIRVGPKDTYFVHLLETLKSLRILTLFASDTSEFENFEFAVLKRLSALHLAFYELPRDPIEFSKLAQLETLQLTVCYSQERSFNISYAVDIIRRLVNLKEFCILCAEFDLNEATFSEIVDTVRGRPHVLTLNWKSNFRVNENCRKNLNVKLNPNPRWCNFNSV